MSSVNNLDNMGSILDFAIAKEVEAQNIYLSYADRTEKRGLRKLLLSMADQEKEHEKRLNELKEGGSPDLVFSETVKTDIRISDYTVDVEFSRDMSYQDFLLLVIKREEKSYQLYKWLLRKADNEEIQLIFRQLSVEEKKHKAWAQDRYDLEILTEN